MEQQNMRRENATRRRHFRSTIHMLRLPDHEVAVWFVRPQFPQPWVKDDFVAVVMVMVLHPNENEMTNCQLGKRDI